MCFLCLSAVQQQSGDHADANTDRTTNHHVTEQRLTTHSRQQSRAPTDERAKNQTDKTKTDKRPGRESSAGGAFDTTVVVFTTGRGTTIGNAIAPVIKLASNTPVFERMSNDLDLSAGTVIDGTETIEEVGQRVFEHIIAVAAGLEAG
jgi:hypothetical protein